MTNQIKPGGTDTLPRPVPKTRSPQGAALSPSVIILDKLGFDPIDEMVKQYERLKKEDEYHCACREGRMFFENAKGELKNSRYSSVSHSATLALLQKVTNDLMRFKYARTPEQVEQEKNTRPGGMVVRLTSSNDENISDAEYTEVKIGGGNK